MRIAPRLFFVRIAAIDLPHHRRRRRILDVIEPRLYLLGRPGYRQITKRQKLRRSRRIAPRLIIQLHRHAGHLRRIKALARHFHDPAEVQIVPHHVAEKRRQRRRRIVARNKIRHRHFRLVHPQARARAKPILRPRRHRRCQSKESKSIQHSACRGFTPTRRSKSSHSQCLIAENQTKTPPKPYSPDTRLATAASDSNSESPSLPTNPRKHCRSTAESARWRRPRSAEYQRRPP